MRLIFTFIVILFLIPVSAFAGNDKNQPIVDGYRDFKFGMSTSQVKKVAGRVCENITFPEAKNCYDGSVPRVRFLMRQKPGGLKSVVNLELGAIRLGISDSLWKTVVSKITEKYGNYIFDENNIYGEKIFWFSNFFIRISTRYTNDIFSSNFSYISVTYFSEQHNERKKAKIRFKNSKQTPTDSTQTPKF